MSFFIFTPWSFHAKMLAVGEFYVTFFCRTGTLKPFHLKKYIFILTWSRLLESGVPNETHAVGVVS